jgi:protein-arginine kinase activator protein McsA
MIVECQQCGKEFETFPCIVEKGNGKCYEVKE